MSGKVAIKFDFYITSFGRSDVDNLLKPLIDIMVKKGVIDDDKKIVQILATKHNAFKPRIDIEIRPYLQRTWPDLLVCFILGYPQKTLDAIYAIAILTTDR